MTKEMISRLNATAHVDFERAKAMLDGINMVLGTKYNWLNRRVVFYDENNKLRDAYAYAE